MRARLKDKGMVVKVEPEHRLEVTHFSPLSGQEDVPANYHTLVYELEQRDGTTRVSLSQDNNSSEEEVEHSNANWEKMLIGLKEIAERDAALPRASLRQSRPRMLRGSRAAALAIPNCGPRDHVPEKIDRGQ